jgi:hypothetical protein
MLKASALCPLLAPAVAAAPAAAAPAAAAAAAASPAWRERPGRGRVGGRAVTAGGNERESQRHSTRPCSCGEGTCERDWIKHRAPPLRPLPPQVNTVLEVLDLSGNVVDYEGVSALAEALAANTTLRTISLRSATAHCMLCGAFVPAPLVQPRPEDPGSWRAPRAPPRGSCPACQLAPIGSLLPEQLASLPGRPPVSPTCLPRPQ